MISSSCLASLLLLPDVGGDNPLRLLPQAGVAVHLHRTKDKYPQFQVTIVTVIKQIIDI